ncbi:unnamed protein product [Paramecium pentaurelia]|uniref:Peptidase M14 domain-containing protein n=1 Tax=Paramecium pentaurelia TaxID=43138 RepID=A0A8S1X6A0_9CILI|nr:unnamed protein product [Paramecium pentaurelia]
MKNISQTVDVKNISKKEDKENLFFYQSIKDKLPKPNPILIQQLQLNKVNSLLPLKKNYLEANEQQITYKTPIQQQEQECLTQKPITLQAFLKPLKLIYQKYQPQQNQNLYATLIHQPDNNFDASHYYQSDEDIKFDSLFESGNLFQVFKKSDKDYILLLQNDINTKGYTQWFYFSISNKNSTLSNIKLSIININKDMCFYRQGMKILINECNYWRKDSLGLSFKKNNIQRNNSTFYYSLSFNYTFIEQGTVYFASNYPYTYSNLQTFISSKYLVYDKILKVKNIITSQAGNEIQIITITNDNKDQKQGLLFIGRQHPGETPSSFVIEGIINALLSAEADELRNKFVIKIIPMLNVDGVVHGNQRCGLGGFDLNRKWGCNRDDTLNEIEKLITNFNENYPIQLILDIHGHSKKLSAFFYGHSCNEFITELCNSDKRFSLENSRFMKNTKYLNHTARVFLQKLLNMNQNIYTLEISYFGYKDQNQIVDFTLNDLRSMGREIINTLSKNIETQIWTESILINEQNSDVSFSDSSISEDEIGYEEIKQIQPEPLREKNNNLERQYPRSNSYKQRQLKSSQTRNRAKSQSIQNQMKYQQFTYNFIDNSFNNNCNVKNDNYDHQSLFIPQQKPKQSEYTIQPLVIMPQHSLKHQFLWQNRLKQQNNKEIKLQNLKEQRDLKIYQEFKDYVNNKQYSNKPLLPKYSFNDTDLFKKSQAKKQYLIINL